MEKDILLEIIEEELGVSDKLSEIANKISYGIKQNITKHPKTKIENGVYRSNFKFVTNILGEKIEFKIHNTFFGDFKIYQEWRKIHKKEKNTFTSNSRTIEINVDYVNNLCHPEELNGAIEHELMHCFQNIESGVEYNTDETYQLAAANVNNTAYGSKMVSRGYFYSHEREIYAYTVQAYESLMNMPNLSDIYGDVRAAIKSTKLYRNYTMLKEAYDFIVSNKTKSQLLELLSKYKISIHHFIERMDWALKEYLKYIGRVVVKVEKDLERKKLEEGCFIDPSDSLNEEYIRYLSSK